MAFLKDLKGVKRILETAGRAFFTLFAAFALAVTGLPDVFTESFGLTMTSDRAYAAEVGNSYVLEVATGVEDGSLIEFFELSYESDDGKTYKQFLFPGEDSLANGRAMAMKYGSDIEVSKTVESVYKYVLQENWDAVGPGTGLKSDSVDQYYFITDKPIKKVTKFDAFLGDKGMWSCQRLQLYKVDSVSGLRLSAIWSDEWYIDYTGSLIAEFPLSKTWSDDNANYLHMTQKADIKTDFSDVSYRNHALANDYGIRIDFADVLGAGLEYLSYEYSEGYGSVSDFSYAEGMAVSVNYEDIYGKNRVIDIPFITNALLWARGFNAGDKKIMGLAGQGETLYFEGSIPDLAAVKSASITLGTGETYKLTGIRSKKTDPGSLRREEKSATDDISLSCVAIYDKASSVVTPYTEGACLKYSFEGDPIFCHVANFYTGEEFYANTMSSVSFEAFGGKSLTPVDNNEYYLVEFVTDEAVSSGTVGDMFVKLSSRKYHAGTFYAGGCGSFHRNQSETWR